MTASPPPAPSRRALSPVARAMHLQRVFARMQEGAGYTEIAAEENISRERLRQIVRRATLRPGKIDHQPSHKRMQIARLTPALRLAAVGVAQGDQKSIPLLLKLVDRLDRYCGPDELFDSPALEELVGRRGGKKSRRGRAAKDLRRFGAALAKKLAEAGDGPDDGRQLEFSPASGQALENAQNGNG